MVKRFFTYLGFNDTSINELQLLTLICLLGKQPNIVIKPADNLYDLLNQILSIYIKAFETNSFLNLTEYEIAEELSKCGN